MYDLNVYAAECREANDRWWRDPMTGEPLTRNKGELLALVHSEVSECWEGLQQNLPDDKLPHRSMEEVELVDALIRIFDYAGAYGLDLQGAYAALTESDHSGDLNEYAIQCGQWCGGRGRTLRREDLLLEVHGEVSKCLEGVRKDAPDKIVPVRRAEEVRLCMAVALICEYAGLTGLDLQGAYEEKMAYNAKRADHTFAGRLAAGGKKF